MELIDREKLIAALEKIDPDDYMGIFSGERIAAEHAIIDVIYEIEKQPTIEAVPVVHGRWELRENDDGSISTYCSVCDSSFSDAVFYAQYEMGKQLWKNKFFYCPNCGAKMDGEERT